MSRDYSVQETIHVGRLSLVQRAIHEPTGDHVVLKTCSMDYPRARDIARVYHEWNLLREIDSPYVVTARALDESGSKPVLVLEYCRAPSLQQIGKPLAMGTFLTVATKLVSALDALHRHGFIHRDVKPDNILFDESDGSLLLLDLNVSARMSAARHEDEPMDMADTADTVAGTLAYMAPEQAGRTGRVVDERADLYAAGVLFYELLTGRLPFTATSSLELIHQHMTATPRPIRELAPTAPASVVAIVARLLAKNPEERYQSARGLLFDLQHAKDDDFVVGSRDVSSRLHLPHALYGREPELATLLSAGRRAHGGEALLVLIFGAAGSGKSSLVDVFEHRTPALSALTASGKCDDLQRSVPQKPIVDALRHILRGILAQRDDDIELWSERIQGAVAPNGAALLEVLPELALVIGAQPELPHVGLVEGSNRFRDTLRKLVQCFARSERPLFLFIDDLQWADPATLSVVQALLTDPAASNLLILGACRDAEIGPESGLPALFEALGRARVTIERIATTDLERGDVVTMLADTLRTTPAHVASLAQMVHEKTHGNPFFVRQFITALYRAGLLHLDMNELAWVWDERAIADAAITDNVVELMIARMRELEPGVQELLPWAACLGSRCDLALLAALAPERSLSDIAGRVMAALRDGVLVTNIETERLLGSLHARPNVTLEPSELASARVAFLHDRVLQAAYAMIPDAERPSLHLRVGRLLHQHLSADEADRHLFDIVEHYCAGEALLTDPQERLGERLEVAALGTSAARRARAANAYAAGVRYARFASGLLPDNAWHEHYGQALELAIIEAECLSLTGEYQAADALCRELESKVHTVDERATLYELRIQQHLNRREYDEAFALLLTQLAGYGVSFPASDDAAQALIGAELAAVFGALGADPAARLLAAATTDEHAHHVITSAFIAIFRVGYLSGKGGIGTLAILRALSYALEHGFSELSSYAVCSFSFLLILAFGEPELGIALGQVAAQLTVRNPSPTARALNTISLAASVRHWHEPLRDTIAHFEVAHELADSVGAYESVAYAVVNEVQARLLSGADLRALYRTHQRHMVTLKRMQNDIVLPFMHAMAHCISALTGLPSNIEGKDHSMLDGQRHGGRVAFELRTALHISRPLDEVAQLIAEVGQVMAHGAGLPVVWDSSFACAMHGIRLASETASERTASERASHIEAVNAQLGALRGWAQLGNVNLPHKIHLVEAELAAYQGRDIEALRGYEEAMELARVAECPHDEALAAERAAAHCRRLELGHMARQYLARARSAYDRWGATAKVRELDEGFGARAMPSTQTRSTTVATLSTSTLSLHTLDMESVLKASLAVTRELRLPQLLETLIQVLMANAGADRAAVLMMRGAELAVVAEARSDGGVAVHLDDPPAVSSWFEGPQSVVRYVLRTRAIEVVGDATAHPIYAQDPYVSANRVRSMVCLPIEKQGELIAVIYIENRVLTDSFSHSQIALISVLAGQIATSLENAMLYAELEQTMRELESSERLKLEFLATVSHELRTPLNAIINLPRILRDALPRDSATVAEGAAVANLSVAEMRDMLDTVRDSGELLLSSIEQMILFSRLEAGIQQFTPVQQLLGQTVARAAATLERTLAEREITLAMDTSASDDAPIHGDARLLERVIENLLSNAIKFSPPGSTVVVDTALAGPFVELSVRDAGPGISEPAQALMFESFRQGSAGTTRRHGGTGLGLTVAKKLVDLHGGTIAVHSQPGQGSTFTVRLPR